VAGTPLAGMGCCSSRSLPIGEFGLYSGWLREEFVGVLWRIPACGQWREIAGEFGLWAMVYGRFRVWGDAGVCTGGGGGAGR